MMGFGWGGGLAAPGWGNRGGPSGVFSKPAGRVEDWGCGEGLEDETGEWPWTVEYKLTVSHDGSDSGWAVVWWVMTLAVSMLPGK